MLNEVIGLLKDILLIISFHKARSTLLPSVSLLLIELPIMFINTREHGINVRFQVIANVKEWGTFFLKSSIKLSNL
jgi:hypothetical protein